ncbi:MAG: FISUMP domain-containing protein [Salinivirgaceae bacterium]
MAKKVLFLLASATIILFVQCKRAPLQTNPLIKPATDFGLLDGEIHLNVTGGKMPYTFIWSNQKTDSIINQLAADTYFVTITDAKNRQLIDTIVVTQPSWPVCVDAQGNSYKTAILGGKKWMVENMRNTLTSKGDSIQNRVYYDSLAYAEVYGLLYTWDAAMNHSTDEGAQGICPDGWHIPTDMEWKALLDTVSSVENGIPNPGKELSLEYAGYYNNSFQNLGASVSFWSSTQANDNAWKRYFHKDISKAFRYHEKKTNAISVRCIKNSSPE